jgi:hypothetical protein
VYSLIALAEGGRGDGKQVMSKFLRARERYKLKCTVEKLKWLRSAASNEPFFGAF